MVVTRHISHDGLLIWPQGANDICPENRGRGERTEKRHMRKSKSVPRQKGQQGAESQEEARGAQVSSSLPAVSTQDGRKINFPTYIYRITVSCMSVISFLSFVEITLETSKHCISLTQT